MMQRTGSSHLAVVRPSMLQTSGSAWLAEPLRTLPTGVVRIIFRWRWIAGNRESRRDGREMVGAKRYLYNVQIEDLLLPNNLTFHGQSVARTGPSHHNFRRRSLGQYERAKVVRMLAVDHNAFRYQHSRRIFHSHAAKRRTSKIADIIVSLLLTYLSVGIFFLECADEQG